MSFAERNKLWLLPVLGLGVALVGWYNVKAFSGPQAATPEASAPQPEVPSEPAPPTQGAAPTASPVPVPAPSPVPGPEGAGLWDDLKALAVVPADLNRLEALDSQARGVLPASALLEGGAEGPRLAGPRVWAPKERPRPIGGHEAASGPAAPDPDILVQLPEGRRVWIDGVGYREQQPLAQAPWRVHRIAPRAVELQGPRGTEVKPIHPPIPHSEKEGP